MKKRTVLSAGLSGIGQMIVQDPALKYNYKEFNHDIKQQIPTKAIGKFGANYFQDSQIPQQNEQINALQRLKKKLKHQDLEQRGYLINQKEHSGIDSQELQIDAPLYDIFDPPNLNYRKIFNPLNLNPVIEYNFNDPNFKEEAFLDENEKLLIQGGLDKEYQISNKKKFILSQLNKKIQKNNNNFNDQQINNNKLDDNNNFDKNNTTRSKSKIEKKVHFSFENNNDEYELIKRNPMIVKKIIQPVDQTQLKQSKEVNGKTDWRDKSNNFRNSLNQIKSKK